MTDYSELEAVAGPDKATQLAVLSKVLSEKFSLLADELMTENLTLKNEVQRITELRRLEWNNSEQKSATITDLMADMKELVLEHEELKRGLHVCRIGIFGKAYDSPGTYRAYTYDDQPDNLGAYRLGEACNQSSQKLPSDFIDLGLELLKNLKQRDLGVFELAAADKPEVKL